MLVGNIADNLLDNVFEGDQAFEFAVFIDHKRKRRLAVAERFELFGDGRGVGHEPRRLRQSWNVDLFGIAAETDLAELCITSDATLVEGEGPTRWSKGRNPGSMVLS